MPRPEPARFKPDLAAWAADLRGLGLAADAEQLELLHRFVEMLARWNSTYNLTAVRDPAAMWVQHLLDCLAAVPAVRSRLQPLPSPRILDVGSGGGLPGVAWAIVMPQAQLTCVDAVGKKAAFVRQVAAELPLTNLQAAHARVESLGDDGGFDLITSRAFASLGDFVRLTRRLLRSHGIWVAMKAKLTAAEIAALPPTVEMFHVEPLHVPHLDADRCLVWMRENGA